MRKKKGILVISALLYLVFSAASIALIGWPIGYALAGVFTAAAAVMAAETRKTDKR